jgi:bifunctional non-homologous end joining protein LigD
LAAAAIAKLPVRSCLIDAEAIVCDANGLAVFDLLRRRWHSDDVILCAFDLLELGWQDLRRAPLEDRKAALAKLLHRTSGGIVFNEHYTGDGAIIYKHACALDCEGIVSKRLGSPYRSGRADCWIKVKNPAAPAVRREAEEDWSGRCNGR